MIFNAKFTLLAFVAAAAAQSSSSGGSESVTGSVTGSTAPAPSGVAGISPCIIGCVQPAAQSVGCSFTDIACVCASAEFQAAAAACLQAKCTPDEVTAAIGLQQSQCGSTSPSGSASGGAASGSRSSSATSTSRASNTASQSPAATTSNAASVSVVGSAWALVAGLLGAVAAAL